MKSTIPEQKLIALQKVLDYMNNRPEQMNLDATFGVVLTEGKERRNHYNHQLKLLNNMMSLNHRISFARNLTD